MKHLREKALRALDVFGMLCLGVVVAMTAVSFFGSWHFVFNLFTHFHTQYLLSFVILIIFFAFRKMPLAITIATMGCIVNTVFLLPYYFQPDAHATTTVQTEPLRVLFNNINYGTTNFSALVGEIAAYQPELVGVAELPFDHYQTLEAALPDYPYHYHVRGRGRLGVALFSKLPFSQEPSVWYQDDQRFATLTAEVQSASGRQIRVLVIHPPPPLTQDYADMQQDIFRRLLETAETTTEPFLVMGDFNSTGWSPEFQQLLASGVLIDSRDNQGVQPSWPAQLPKPLRISIDQMLTNSQLTTIKRVVLPDVGSDHLPILTDFVW